MGEQTPDPKLIDSMAMRYRHDFGLLDEPQKEAIRTTMKQLWEEVVGLGFYKPRTAQQTAVNPMAQYRKKPVIIEAEQFVICDTKNPPPFITILGITFPITKDCTIVVPTLEGQHIASNLDFIIKGVKGEVYPCKPDIFEMTYEPVN